MKECSSMDRVRALNLLKEAGCDDSVVAHCIAVSEHAVKIASEIKKQGHKVDIKFVEIAGLLHDIGRSRTHGIRHGVEGAKILRDYPRYARVCETHIGAGLSREDALSVGLEARDYLPETLEERIIAHADTLIEGTKTTDINEAIKKLESKLGKDHPVINRVRRLSEELESLTK